MVKIVLTDINEGFKRSKLFKDMIFNDNDSLYINLRLTKEWKKEKSKNTTEVHKRNKQNGDLIAWLRKDQKDAHARKDINTWCVKPRNLGQVWSISLYSI